jgi:uncharacterized protein YnzC (UPF0291/DUF896 family)
MMDDAKIQRINALAKKQREGGLSDAEKAEQHKLRREYIDAVKASLRPQLESIQFVDEPPISLRDQPRTGD